MNEDRSFNRGLLVGAHALHWLLTPALHPDATTVRHLMVVGQAMFGFGGALWVYIAHRAESIRRR